MGSAHTSINASLNCHFMDKYFYVMEKNEGKIKYRFERADIG
jgi:hypothetical protein